METSENFNFAKKEKAEKETMSVISDIDTFKGIEKKPIEIKLENGFPKAAAFYDIDGTLGHFKDMHGEAISRLYPDHDAEEVVREFYRGISLGTTYRVHDRMIKIYEDGMEKYKDPEKYMEWFSKHVAEVDEAGPVHEKAAEYSMKHSNMSAQIAEEIYKKDPSSFDKYKLLPVFRLAAIYKRMGIPQAVMTANDYPFAKSICKCLNLGDSFVTMVSQQDFEGRGKDGAIERLAGKFKEKGIPLPKKIIVVGDSLNGDIGSGAKFMANHPDFEVRGVFVGDKKVEKMKEMVENNPLLKNMEVEVLNPGLVEENFNGQPNISGYRKKYDTKN